MKPIQILVLVILIAACFFGLVLAIVPAPVALPVGIFMAFCMVALAKQCGVEM